MEKLIADIRITDSNQLRMISPGTILVLGSNLLKAPKQYLSKQSDTNGSATKFNLVGADGSRDVAEVLAAGEELHAIVTGCLIYVCTCKGKSK